MPSALEQPLDTKYREENGKKSQNTIVNQSIFRWKGRIGEQVSNLTSSIHEPKMKIKISPTHPSYRTKQKSYCHIKHSEYIKNNHRFSEKEASYQLSTKSVILYGLRPLSQNKSWNRKTRPHEKTQQNIQMRKGLRKENHTLRGKDCKA